MSTFKRELDAVTPPENLKGKVKSAVSGAVAEKRLAPRKFLGVNLQSWAALAGVVMIISLVIMGAVIGTGGSTPENYDLISFDSVSELQEYIKDFNSNKYYNGNTSTAGAGSEFESDVKGDAAPTSPESGNAGKEHSTTNNQVQGVSESDIVHTDGTYIYTLSYYNLTIINAQSLSVTVDIKYDNFFPDSMFLLKSEGLLVVIGSEYDYSAEYFKSGNGSAKADVMDGGYYCYWYGNTIAVKVYEIDTLLEGRDAPVREMKFKNAYFNSARMIGGNLYMVLNAYNYYRGEEIWIPQVYDSKAGETKELPIQNIFATPHNGESMNYTLLAGLDVTKNESASVNAYLGSSGTIFASAKGLYTTFNFYKDNYSKYCTGIIRFEIDGINLKYVGGGSAQGSALNQFSMDEYTYSSGEYKDKTYFRIATTLGNQSASLITVFDSDMKQVGELNGLGEEGERIYAVRFSGEKAVVVTFMQTDPLYVVDLSKPSAPAIISALKIPGVSDYLHFLTVKDNYVFAVGRRQALNGNFLTGVKVSLYDISGTEAAREVAYYEVGPEYSYAEATYNHKAIMYFKPSSGLYEVFAFAVNSYNYVNGWYGYKANHNLYYYTASAAGLQQEILNYSSPEISDDSYYYSYYQDSIRRSVIIGSYVYLVGYYGIERYNTSDFNGSGNYVSQYAALDVEMR